MSEPLVADPGARAGSRARVRHALLALSILAVPLTWSRDVQLVWQPLLAIPLLLLPAFAVARIQVGAVLLLLLLGGSVTTYRVGMAVPDWPSTFEQNMWRFPLRDMLAMGQGVTLEHSHRLFATAVGLIAICQLVVAWSRRERPAVTRLSLAALLAIIALGVLGGLRVLENQQSLAFLHGALAQLVFGTVVAAAVVASPSWRDARPRACVETTRLRRSARLAVLVVYVQIVLGAATRHSGHHAPLALHLATAVAVLAVVTVLIGRLSVARQACLTPSPEADMLRSLRRITVLSLHTQILLGILVTAGIFVWSGGFEGAVSVGEAIFASLHVAGGAVLLAACLTTAMWARRALAPVAPPESTN